MDVHEVHLHVRDLIPPPGSLETTDGPTKTRGSHMIDLRHVLLRRPKLRSLLLRAESPFWSNSSGLRQEVSSTYVLRASKVLVGLPRLRLGVWLRSLCIQHEAMLRCMTFSPRRPSGFSEADPRRGRRFAEASNICEAPRFGARISEEQGKM